MNVVTLLKKISDKGARIQRSGGELVIDAPEDSQLDDVIDEVRKSKDEIIAFLKGRSSLGVENVFEVSPAQQRMLYFDSSSAHNSAMYNLLFCYEVRGELDLVALRSAVNRCINRHDILRTKYAYGDSHWVQLVDPAIAVNHESTVYRYEDLANRDNVESVLQERISLEQSRKFDLENEWPIRVLVLRKSSSEYVLCFVFHHIAVDGWSSKIIVRDLREAYVSYIDGTDEIDETEHKVVQYGEYAKWCENEERLTESREYWVNHLSQLPVCHEICTDRNRPSLFEEKTSSLHKYVSKDVENKIGELAAKYSTTNFVIYQFCFSVLLYRFSGCTDISFGTLVANRNSRKYLNTVGLFVNTLVLRRRVDPSESIARALETAKRIYHQAIKHQSYPFDALVEELNPVRSQSFHPLVQIMLGVQENNTAEFDLPGVSVDVLDVDEPNSPFDLSLDIKLSKHGAEFHWCYNTALFNASTIETMASCFERLVHSLLEKPDGNVFELDVLSERERHQQLIEWNDTRVDYPHELCIHELFEQQVARSPEATAVQFGEERLSYQQLNEKSNQLAHYLVTERGV
ncbi:condensation domain-containing protein, partial [Gilvimarinus sp. SDUM040013]